MDHVFYYLTDLSGGIAYLIIFGILVACGLGFPLPEDIPLIATGYLVWDETLSWLPAILVTLGGVLIGDTILFLLGRNLGLRFIEGRAQHLFKPDKVRRVRAYFRKYGGKVVFYARFVAGFRAAAFFMAGAMKMPYRRFLSLDSMAATISVPLWVALGYGLGYWFGDEISAILANVRHLKHIITGVILLIIVFVVIQQALKYRQAKKDAAKKKRRATATS